MQWKSNLLIELKNGYLSELQKLYSVEESQQLLAILIKQLFGLSRSALASQAEYRISESEMLQLHFAVKRLLNYEPIQYVIGHADFMDIKLHVNEGVLIPRPETEELVQYIIDNEQQTNLEVLDVGTGSGCIGIALAKFLDHSMVTVVDISENALRTARKNAVSQELDMNYICMDFLEESQWKDMGSYDIIVSNPPYVRESEKSHMHANVLDYEPYNALFVPDENALVFYEAILGFSKLHLKTGGRIYFEINEKLGLEVQKILTNSHFTHIILHNDFHGKERYVSALKPDTEF